jgi:hypothetical protein
MDRNSLRTASRHVVVNALLAALMTVLQVVMAPLPNIEPVSLLILVYTLVYGGQVFYIVYTFVLLEGLLFGFHLWWVHLDPVGRCGFAAQAGEGKASADVGRRQRGLWAQLWGAGCAALSGRRADGRLFPLGVGDPFRRAPLSGQLFSGAGAGAAPVPASGRGAEPNRAIKVIKTGRSGSCALFFGSLSGKGYESRKKNEKFF